MWARRSAGHLGLAPRDICGQLCDFGSVTRVGRAYRTAREIAGIEEEIERCVYVAVAVCVCVAVCVSVSVCGIVCVYVFFVLVEVCIFTRLFETCVRVFVCACVLCSCQERVVCMCVLLRFVE